MSTIPKKILIFWLWFQGRKYLEYFYSWGYAVEVVTSEQKVEDKRCSYSYLYRELKDKWQKFYEQFVYIVVAVQPLNNQTHVIKGLLWKKISSTIIIEKPVTDDIDLLNKLIKKRNIIFFFDELALSWLVKKIYGNEQNLQFVIYEKCDPNSILEHAIAAWFLDKDFFHMQSSIQVYNKNAKNNYETHYKIIWKKHVLSNTWWRLELNGKEISVLSFPDSLHKCLLLKTDQIFLSKVNYYLFRMFHIYQDIQPSLYLNLKPLDWGVIYDNKLPNNEVIDFVLTESMRIVFWNSHSYLSNNESVLYAWQASCSNNRIMTRNNCTGHYKINSYDYKNQKMFEDCFKRKYEYDISDNFAPYPLCLLNMKEDV